MVRRNIKRKERERQQKREDFREEFGELLESQDLSNETQKLILEELRNINNDENVVLKPKRLLKRPRRISLSDSSSSEEVSSVEIDIPDQRLRLPNLLYQGAKNIGSKIYNRLYPPAKPEDQANREIQEYQANLQRRQEILDSQQQLIAKEDEILQTEQQLNLQRQRLRELQQKLYDQAQIPDIPVQTQGRDDIAKQRDNLRNMWENLEKQREANEKVQKEREELADLQEEMLRQAQDSQLTQEETGQRQLQRIRELLLFL